MVAFRMEWHLDARSVGDVAQLGEHLLCKQGVVGSIPIVSTIVVDEADWLASAGGSMDDPGLCIAEK